MYTKCTMERILAFSVITLLFFQAAGCGGGKEQTQAKADPVKLTVSAAASLKNAAEELKTIYAGQRPNVAITYNFASSGTLQKQIEEGAPVDIFISAGKSQMDALAQQDLIIGNSRKDLLSNELVLIAGKDSKIAGFESLTQESVAKVCIGTPETVPAGKYAREVLTNLKLLNKLQPKLVLAKDVWQVLTYVESGNVDAGMVFLSDALTGKDIKIVAVAPAGSHEAIIYPMAVIKSARHLKEAEEFTGFLLSDEAAQVFAKYGFKAVRDNFL